MEKTEGKTAFITGGASGIGLGIAKACVRHGMKVVITDVRQHALDEAMSYFKKNGFPVHGIQLDVTDREAYVRAADEAEEVLGKIHVLINNAGVGTVGGGFTQNATFKDWDFVLGVNLGGVINGIVIILPRILAHGEGGHVVATSSTNGLFAMRGNGVYNTSKFAVTGLMESLASDLCGTNVGVSLFCPGLVSSNLGVSTWEVRPDHLKNEGEQPPLPPKYKFVNVGMDPEEVGERVLQGIKRNDLFIFTHPEFKEGVRVRNEALLRAFPNEPVDERRRLVIRMGNSTVLYNPIYEMQTTPGPLNWPKNSR
ncbi:MAG: SDR family NAD(P)-dependent oxidoreductase [Firmicutes bacterium]|nr:SDR family NAD(P)-dependent oxidoreductase [Bacillota bacterium]